MWLSQHTPCYGTDADDGLRPLDPRDSPAPKRAGIAGGFAAMSADRGRTVLAAIGDVVPEAVPVLRRADTGAKTWGITGGQKHPPGGPYRSRVGLIGSCFCRVSVL